jgi:copper(I)-binding protein
VNALIPRSATASPPAPRAQADEYKVGAIVIGHPGARATPKNAPVAGGYLKDHQHRDHAGPPRGGAIEVAKRFEIHEMKMDGGVMKMRELKMGWKSRPVRRSSSRPGLVSHHDDETCRGRSRRATRSRAL